MYWPIILSAGSFPGQVIVLNETSCEARCGGKEPKVFQRLAEKSKRIVL